MKRRLTVLTIIVACLIVTLGTWLILGRIGLLVYARIEGIDLANPAYVDYGWGLAWAVVSVPLLSVLLVLSLWLGRRALRRLAQRQTGSARND